MVKATPAWISGNFENVSESASLSLRGQRITQIDDISHLVNLKKLDLSENELGHPDSLNGLSHMYSITQLVLAKNRLFGVDHIFNMRRLAVLNLSHNLLKTLPIGIEQLTELKALMANNNELTCVAPVKLPKSLNSLILSNNQIEFIAKDDIRHLCNLRKLSLSHNRLHSLPEAALPDGLKELRVNGNKLTTIKQLPNSLEIVDLGNNMIVPSALDALKPLRLLKSINLAGNAQLALKPESLDNPRLEIVDGKPRSNGGGRKKKKSWPRDKRPNKTNNK